MQEFWRLAGRMLRYRWMVALAAVAAVISAAGLGVGLLGLAPILANILGDEPRLLPDLARDVNQALAKLNLNIPESWIASLPSGRFDAVLWIVLILAALTLVGAFANFLHAYLTQTLAARVVAGIRRDAYRRVLHMPMSSVVGATPEQGVNDIVSRLIADSLRLNSGFQALMDKGPAQVAKGAIAFTAAVIIDAKSLTAIPVALLLGVMIRKLGKRVRRASRGAMAAQSRLLSVASESLHGLRVVKAHTTERYELGRFGKYNRAFLKETLRARTARAIASPAIEAAGIFVLGAWSLYFADRIIDGAMDKTDFLAALAALGVSAASLKPLSGIVQEVQGSSPAAKRLAELIDAKPESSSREDRASRSRRLPRHTKDISFENARLTYPGADHPALNGVSLHIPHGQIVAFVGGNGSGKTTLVSLVPRLFDAEDGRVCIDGIDVRTVQIRSLRRQIGYVTQDVVLFEGTIASNIAYGAQGATRAKIEHAARLARAHDFIMSKPGGYDAPVGERGVTLSGGQRQRIALARAFLRDPSILILDEATSMIDAESEAQIGSAIEEFSRGRTTLIVAHRLSTILNADRIVVMDAGRILDCGAHADLMQRCEPYRTLIARQIIPPAA
ncbi:MAG: ABC transporter ATP-binding protein [Phycisphaerales bacterium]